jgi:acyl-lipid omega-6 desaturase (Delta-12 desaturase)
MVVRAALPFGRCHFGEHQKAMTPVWSAKELRAALEPYAVRSSTVAWALFLATMAAYLAAVVGAVASEGIVPKLAAAVIAGAAISALFVIGHDAAHGAYTDGRRMNAVIGRIAFLPALHNYSLWQVQHNRLHHRLTNIKGFNSWSPLTKAEYDGLPGWRRALERLYRGPLGFAPYYVVQRWWKDKFFPRGRGITRRQPIFWLDFALLLAYLAIFVAVLLLAASLSMRSALGTVFWGLLVPFAVWNAFMGATVYMQHTHERAPWFEAIDEWRLLAGQEEVTVQVVVPRWFGLISHHIMDHTAHHLHPKIPLYRLAAAQRRLNEILGERVIVQRFTLRYLLTTLARCKLYDYRAHRWLDFAGRATSDCNLPPHLSAASALPEARPAVA